MQSHLGATGGGVHDDVLRGLLQDDPAACGLQFRGPFVGSGLQFGSDRVALLFELRDLAIELFDTPRLLARRRSELRAFVVVVGVLGLIEVGEELVVLTLRDRVVLVAVTLRTAHRQPHPDLERRIHAVLHSGDAKLFVVGSALVVDHRVAMEGSRENLLGRRVGEQVASELLARELVIRQVAVVGVDQPVSVTPHRAHQVFLVALRVGIARDVEPHPCPTFTECG